MNSAKFINDCKKIISEESSVDIDNVVNVWFCKTLQHYKGLFYNFINEKYYECTYNGIQELMYIDTYVKEFNNTYCELNIEMECEEDVK